MDHQALKNWFLQEARDLPWRNNPSPYEVWVSEVMLQQTQVAVVIPYFERWMQLFPTVKALSEAPLELVIKTWEGLGYYSRARNLHAGARTVMQRFGGIIPSSEEDLSQIKGLGPYTIGAIRAFAFKQRAAAVDGNVIRVLTRYWNLADDVSKPSVITHLRKQAHEALPLAEPWIVSEALIELGATICNRTPHCHRCPLQASCAGFAAGTAATLPVKSKRVETTFLYRAVALVLHDNHVLVRRCEKGEVMSDLHEFPYLETNKQGLSSAAFQKRLKQQWGLSLQHQEDLRPEKHSFTRYSVTLKPVKFINSALTKVEGYQWVSLLDIGDLPFSSGHRRVLANLLQRSP